MKKNIFRSVAVVFFSLFSGIGTSWAAEPLSLMVAPLYFDLSVDPGQEKNGEIYLQNNSPQPVEISAEFSDFFIDDKGGYIFSEDREIQNENLRPYLMKQWLSLEKEKFTLAATEEILVKYKIRAPAEANLGGHYGAIFFRTNCSMKKDEAVIATDKSTLCVSGRVGVLFLVRTGGESIKKVGISKAEIPLVTFRDKTKISIELFNAGNIHTKPEGLVVVKDVFGQEVFNMPIRDKLLLPATHYQFSSVFEQGRFPGVYHAIGMVEEGSDKSVYLSRWFWVVPWREGLLLLGSGGGVIFWTSRKFQVRRKG